MTRGKLTVVVALAVALAWDWFGSRLWLDAEDILALQPGMTMTEVRSIMGDALVEDVRGDYHFMCSCNLEKTCWQPSRTTWTYTRKPFARLIPFLTFPMVWVHFNSRGHLDEVYVKEYSNAGMDRKPIYIAKLDPCDPTDRTPLSVTWFDPVVGRDQVRRVF